MSSTVAGGPACPGGGPSADEAKVRWNSRGCSSDQRRNARQARPAGRAGRRCRRCPGPPPARGELGEDVLAECGDQVVVAVEVAVERGRGHAHPAGGGAQRQRLGALLDQQAAGGRLDLLRGRVADPLARRGAARRIDTAPAHGIPLDSCEHRHHSKQCSRKIASLANLRECACSSDWDTPSSAAGAWCWPCGALFVLAGVWGTGVFGSLISSGFETPGSESARALRRVEDTVGRGAADVVVLYRRPGPDRGRPGVPRGRGEPPVDLPEGLVAGTTTYWSAGSSGAGARPGAEDREPTYAVLQLVGDDEDALMDAYEELEPTLREAPEGLDVRLGGNEAIASDITTQVGEDIARAEQLSMPIVLVLLVVIFGGLVAASLPLAIGGLAILGAFTMLRVLTLVTDVSVFSINIVTMLGLGLAIDYALFVVSRFREERRPPGATTEGALARTMATAGRTVAFSGRDRGDRAGLAAVLPAGLPAVDGLRRHGGRAGRDARRAHRAAGAARRARPPGRLAAHPDPAPAAARVRRAAGRARTARGTGWRTA